MIVKQLDDAGAVFDDTETYRYQLHRWWDTELPVMVFVMLNPSTADEMKVDPTITRCITYAKREGCGGLFVVNLFAYRSAYPTDLLTVDDPVGPENDSIIVQTVTSPIVSKVVGAWGTYRLVRDRAPAVEKLLDDAGVILHRLGEPCADGNPRHPLYPPAGMTMADVPLVPHVRLSPMVSKANGRTTLTAVEAEVINALKQGPADTGPKTERFTRRGEWFQMVDRKVCRRLVKAGLIRIDLGGQAHLVPQDDG